MALNYLEYGYISDRDSSKGLVKVHLPVHGEDYVTDWISMIRLSTKDDKEDGLPDIDTFVACMMDAHGDTGVCLGALYSERDQPADGAGDDLRRIVYKDGTIISYDRQAHELSIDNKQHDVKVKLNGGTLGGIPILQKILDNLNLVKQNMQTLEQAVSTGLGAVGVGTAANGGTGAAAFNSAAAGISWPWSDMEDKNASH